MRDHDIDALRSTVIVALSSALAAAAYTLYRFASRGVGFGLLWEEAAGVALLFMPYAAVIVGALLAALAFAARRLRPGRAGWLRGGPWIVATVLVLGTLLSFGPIGGFHHMFRLGVLGYAVLDCESPSRTPIPFGSCGARGSALLLAVTFVSWVALVVVARRLLGRRERPPGG